MSMDQECRECGCTDDAPCLTSEGPCCWVEHDLCSACADAGVEAEGEGDLLERDDDGFALDPKSGLWLP